jgi:hypothetical protein
MVAARKHTHRRHFLLTFGASGRPPVAAVIIEAPSMLQARMIAVVRRLAPGVPFGDGVRLTARMMAKIPPERIGRVLYGEAATHLILRLRKSRRRAGE